MTNTILIIDDNVEVCGNISELLKLAGYQTFTAQNGKSGLQLAHEHKPNLILCDIVNYLSCFYKLFYSLQK